MAKKKKKIAENSVKASSKVESLQDKPKAPKIEAASTKATSGEFPSDQSSMGTGRSPRALFTRAAVALALALAIGGGGFYAYQGGYLTNLEPATDATSERVEPVALDTAVATEALPAAASPEDANLGSEGPKAPPVAMKQETALQPPATPVVLPSPPLAKEVAPPKTAAKPLIKAVTKKVVAKKVVSKKSAPKKKALGAKSKKPASSKAKKTASRQ